MKSNCASHLFRFANIIIPISLGFTAALGYIQIMAHASDNLVLPEDTILHVDAEATGAANGLD